MKKWTAVTMFALLSFAGPVAGQAFGVGAFGGVSLPMGDYKDETGADAGYAKTGFTVGADLFVPISAMEGLTWMSSLGITTHGADDGMATAFGGSSAADVGRYVLIPALTGARFDIPVATMRAYLAAQLGLVFVKGPKLEEGEAEITWDLGSKFGFALGGGLQVTDRIHVGARYVPLGEFEAEGEAEGPGGSQEVNEEVGISFVEFMVGYRIF